MIGINKQNDMFIVEVGINSIFQKFRRLTPFFFKKEKDDDKHDWHMSPKKTSKRYCMVLANMPQG